MDTASTADGDLQGGGAGQGGATRHVQQRRHALPAPSTPAAVSVAAQSLPPLPSSAALPMPSGARSTTPAPATPAPPLAAATAAKGAPAPYRPASAKPPLSRIPTFPLVDAYVPDTTSHDKRHPRQLVPKDLGFPTPEMAGKIRKDDLDDRLLMATCAVLHGFENRALCPKEVAEVMLERDWLKNAGTTPFAHVSTCIRSHIARASSATPPYLPLLTPFELVGALTAEEVRAVGLHAEQRPAVKRGTLWYLNPKVFGPGCGADDPFVRCRREAGLAPSDREGLYVRGLVPLQAAQPTIPPDLKMSSAIFHSNGADEGEGEGEGSMGRGRRKRRASSAMMAAIASTPSAPSPLSASVGASSASPVPIPSARSVAGVSSAGHRRSQSFAGPQSAPVRSSLPKLKLRLTALEEHDSGLDDSDGHTGEAAERRRKNKKKVRTAGSEGLSRAGSVDSSVYGGSDDELAMSGSFASRPSAFSSMSSSALLAQSLLAASTPAAALPRSQSSSAIALDHPPLHAVSPDILSLGPHNPPVTSFPFSRPASQPLNLSMSAPNIFSHHFASAPSPPDVMDVDAPSPEPSLAAAAEVAAPAAPSPASEHTTDEDDFHEAMLRGDDLLDFEWGSESYTSTAGTSSIEASAPVSSLTVEAEAPHAEGKGKGRALTPASPASFDELSLEAALRQKAAQEEQPAGVDTPATTPRSPGKDLDVPVEASEEPSSAEEQMSKVDEAKIEIVPGPLGTISRVGMSTTLCGEMDGEDVDVIVISDDEDEGSDTTGQPSISLTSLVHDTPPSTRRSPRADSAHLAAPPPSPLPLEFSAMGALTNAFAATDFDFVGYDEADRSPFFRGSSLPSYGDGDSADDEDDLITVKIEEEEPLGLHSAPSSRASSACPAAPQFDTRLLAGVRAASTASSSSDSDSFDPMTFVSAPLLATGLTIPQHAPSPPDTGDWSLGVDALDDLEGELAGVDLAPESLDLSELDLAWAREDEEAPSPQPPSPSRPRLSIPRAGSAAFLTGSRFTSTIPSPRRVSSSRAPVLADFGKPAPPTLTRTSSAATIFSLGSLPALPPLAAKPVVSPSAAVNIKPLVPLDPPVIATVVQRGILVFSIDVLDLATSTPLPLFRRLDTDYCNMTTLLQSTFSSSADRSAALSSLLASTSCDAFHVSSPDAGLGGTWVPLSAARHLAGSHPSSFAHLAAFLEDDLAARFPEPIPTMHGGLLSTLSQKSGKEPDVLVLGQPPFDGAEVRRREQSPEAAGGEDEDEDEEIAELEHTPPPPRRTGRARKPSAAVKAEMESPTASPRKSRRSAAK
ncbi:hypothetical protein JCM10213_006351 [Rhodosporidiobolus nylandii]